MTLEELAASLPNGFHDAYIKGISIDYVSGTASFDLELWVGDDSAERKEEREVYRDARVTLSDLLFCVIEPPDSRYPYYDKKNIVGRRRSMELRSAVNFDSTAEPATRELICLLVLRRQLEFIHLCGCDGRSS